MKVPARTSHRWGCRRCRLGPKRAGWRPGLGLLVLILLSLAACSEWDKYWEQGTPTGPEPVVDGTPPAVRIVTPTGPDSATATPVTGDAYRIVVEADDDTGVSSILLTVGAAAPVELLVPSALQKSVSAEMVWDTTALDETSVHAVSATASDASGNAATSETMWAQVFNSGPEVVIADPVPDARVRGVVPFTVSFPAGDAGIARVEFLANVWTIDVVTSPPWTTNLDTTTLPAGRHYLAAKATTVLDFVGVSSAVGIRVNNGTPAVTLDFPPDGHQAAPRGTVPLEASATDALEGALPDSQVVWVSDVDGPLGTGHALPVTGLTPGSHAITVTGTNSWGAPDSAAIQLNILSAPTVGYCSGVQRALFEIYLCTWCHDPAYPDRGYQDNGLDMTTLAGLLAGGNTTLFPSVVPGKPESSFVYNKLTAAIPWVGDPMPNDPAFPVPSAAVINNLRTWILEGAPPDDPPDCP